MYDNRADDEENEPFKVAVVPFIIKNFSMDTEIPHIVHGPGATPETSFQDYLEYFLSGKQQLQGFSDEGGARDVIYFDNSKLNGSD